MKKFFSKVKDIIKINKELLLLVVAILSLILMLVSNYSSSINLAIFSLALAFAINFIDALCNLKDKTTILFFLIGFFTFTMGQYFFKNVNNQFYFSNFDTNIIIHTIFIQYTALIITFLTIKIMDIFFKKKSKELVEKKEPTNRRLILILLLIGLSICFICSFINNIDTAIRVSKYGYLVVYDGSHPSNLPGYINYLGNAVIVFLSIFLVLCKNKNVIFTILAIYFINICSSIFTGARGNFVLGILYIIFYLIVYQYKYKVFKIKTIKFSVIAILVLIPISMVGLSIFNSVRNKVSVSNINITQQINSFMVDQSTSVNLISFAKEYEEILKEKNTNYVLGPVIESLDNKIRILSLGNLKLNGLQELENIRKNNFATDITIEVLGYDMYKKGHGLGSQYLAEIYIDFGYIGIIIFSIIFTSSIYIMNKAMYKHWIVFALTLITFQSIVYISRGQTAQFVTSLSSLNFWLVILGIYVIIWLSNLILKRRNSYESSLDN